MRVLNNDFRDILSIFNEEAVDYLVVGAYALAAHGLPRATGDIDLWIRCDPANAGRVLQALARFGAPLHDVAPDDFLTPGIVFQIGVAPRRIDILTAIDGIGFEEAWAHRLSVKVNGLTVPVIGRRDLERNKRAAGRPKDLLDAEWLAEGGSSPS